MSVFWRSPVMMTWLALAVRLGGFALLMPLVLAKFTDAEVSVWLLFSTIAGFQLIADFGFGPTFSREIAYGYAGRSLIGLNDEVESPIKGEPNATSPAPNWSAIASATVAMLELYRWIALVALILLLMFGSWAVMTPVERTTDPQTVWVAWGIVAMTTALSIYGNAYSSYLVGAGKIELQKRWEAVVSGIGLVAQSLTVMLEMGLLGLVLVGQICIAVQVLVNRALAYRLSRGHFGNGNGKEAIGLVMQSIWPAAWRTAIGAIMSFGVSQGMAVAVANILVASEAAAVQLALRVMQIISQFSQVPYYVGIPRLNRLRATDQIELLAAEAASAMRTSLWIYVCAALLVDFGIRKVLFLISSQTSFTDDLFWLVLTFAILLERYGAMHIQLLLTNNTAIAHIANGVTGTIWIVTMFILFPIIGVLALPLSMLLAYAGFYGWFSVLCCHRSMPGVSLWHFEKRVVALPSILMATWTVVVLLERTK